MSPLRLAAALIALLAALAVLVAPAAAPAATVSADLERRQGTEFGLVRFTAAAGERNRLTVSPSSRGTRFRDRGASVRARGDCEQVDRRTAVCPTSEDGVRVLLRDGDDRATVRTDLVEVRGGTGRDVLAGGRGIDDLRGDAGDDRLGGGGGSDELTGGSGRDRVEGGGGDDTLLDGETDGQAAPDVFAGGRQRTSAGVNRGDAISYASRRRAVRIDLRSAPATTTGDRFTGVESAIGGRGNDRLSGDGRDNQLEGGPGDDAVRGRGGRDVVLGGAGDDRVAGDDGDDVVWGDEGADALSGGDGGDFLISREERGAQVADELACGDDPDSARADGADRLTAACEELIAFSNGLRARTIPAIAADRATFTVTCAGDDPIGCRGTLTLTGPAGEAFGVVRFLLPRDTADAPVTVPLSAAALAALREGALVRVAVVSDRPADVEEPGGYRVRLRAG